MSLKPFSPLKSEKQKRRESLQRIRARLEEDQLPPEEHARSAPARPEPEWRDLIEQQIQEAMAQGAFDNLRGKGKPLDLNRNPYADPAQDMEYGLLKNNGFAPEWIERDKEIRRELDIARQRLQVAWQHYQANPDREATWRTTVAHFEECLARLNRKIDDFNLIVPIVSSQRPRLHLADELDRLQDQ